MNTNLAKRTLSLLLSLVLLAGNLPLAAFAAEKDGLCEHHTTHEDCGYLEGVSSCGYVCTECRNESDTAAEPAVTEAEPAETQETVPIVTESAATEENPADDVDEETTQPEDETALPETDPVEDTDTAESVIVDSEEETVSAEPVAAATHSHPLCGSGSCDCTSNSHSSNNWTAWDGTTKMYNGYYYLTEDIVLSSTMILDYSYTSYLCLNGHSITCEDTVFDIYSYRFLVITDCVGTGKIESTNARPTIANNKYLSIWGGTISNSNDGWGSAIECYAGTTTYVCQGRVEATNGEAIYACPGSSVYIEGGELYSDAEYLPAISGHGSTDYTSRLTISGGQITVRNTSNGAVEVQDGNFTMTGGYLDGSVYLFDEEGTTSVSGGTINGWLDSCNTTTITGGDMSLMLWADSTISAGTFRGYCEFGSTAATTVTGGDFSACDTLDIVGETWICGGSFNEIKVFDTSLNLSGVPEIASLAVYYPSAVSAQNTDGTGNYGGNEVEVLLFNPDSTTKWKDGDIVIQNVISDAVAKKFTLSEDYGPWQYLERSGNNLVLRTLPHGECGENAYWGLQDGTLTIYGTGAITYNYTGHDYPWGDYHDEITQIVVESGITEIPSYTFEFCEQAETIILPDTLEKISLSAFNDCGSLNNLILPASLVQIGEILYDGSYNRTAFIRCESLADVYFMGTEAEWDQVGGSPYVVSHQSDMTLHFLQLQESGATCTEAGLEPHYRFDDTSVYDGYYDINKQPIDQPESIPALGHRVYMEDRIPVDPLTVTNASSVPFTLADGTYTSNNKNHNSSSEVQITARYACTLTLNYGVSSEQNWDKLFILINGVQKDMISGSVANKTLTLSLAESDVVTVRYSKDGSASSGQDQGWFSVSYEPVWTEGSGDVQADILMPDCTNGVVCDYCGTVVKDAAGHMEVTIPAQEANCTYTGLTEGRSCSVCGEVLEAQEVIPVNGVHSYINGVCTYCGLADYGISVGSVSVTSESLSGTNWSYDPQNQILHLTDCFDFGISAARDNLIIEVSGSAQAVSINAEVDDLTIRGDGDSNTNDTLTITNYGLAVEGSNLRVENVTLSVTYSGGTALFVGTNDSATGTLTISNAHVEARSTDSGRALEGILVGRMIVNGASYVYGSSSRPNVEGIYISGTGSSFSPECHVVARANTGTAFRVNGITLPEYAYIYNGGVYGPSAYTKKATSEVFVNGNYSSGMSFEFVGMDHVTCTQSEDGLTHSVTCGCDQVLNQEEAHDWTYTLESADTIAAECICGAAGSLKLLPPENLESNCLVTREATLEGSIPGAENPEITYTGDLTNSKPVNTGTYSANITLGDITASISFTLTGTTHTEVIDEAVPATCTETGLTEGKHCSACDAVLIEQEETPALGHRVILEQPVEVEPLVITNTGTVPFVLTDGTYYSNNHTDNSSSQFTITAQHPCTLTLNYGVSSEQNYDKLFILCNGVQKAMISGTVSNQTMTLNLTAGDVVTVRYTKDVSVSNNQDKGWVTLNYEKHTYPTGSEVSTDLLEPDCTHDVVCTYCDTVVKEALGHTEAIDAAVEANCTNTGLTEGSHCAVCGEILVAQEEIPTNRNHNFVDDVCTFCGITGGICGENVYWTLEDGVLTISGEGEMDEYEWGYESPWYDYRESILSVKIENGVTSFCDHAFDNCENLAYITISESVNYIGWVGSNLEAYYVEKGNQTYADIDGVLLNADKTILLRYPAGRKDVSYTVPDGVTHIESCNNNYLVEVMLPDSLQSIGEGAFAFSENLSEITIPEGVATIGAAAFEYCYKLKEVNIPASVVSMGSDDYPLVFDYCPILEAIEVSEDNPNYADIDGVLVSKDKKTLIQFPAAKTAIYNVPEGIKTIGTCAFLNSKYLVSITLPDSVTEINTNSFFCCSALESVTLSPNITTIDDVAFNMCPQLAKITIPANVSYIGRSGFGLDNLATVIFEGNCPEIHESAFYSVLGEDPIVAYYPGNNSTWTEDKLKDYGREINWVAYQAASPVAQIGGTSFASVEQALAAARSGDTITLIADTTSENYLVLPAGVSLNLGEYHLEAEGLIAFSGSVVQATPNTGRLILPKGKLILQEAYVNEKGQHILPVWDPANNSYVFSLFVANTANEVRGLFINEEAGTLYFQWKHQATGAINKSLLADNGSSDNDVSILVRLQWGDEDGVAYQNYVFKDSFVQKAAGSFDYTVTLKGIDTLGIDLSTLVVTAMITTESGAEAVGTVWTLENAK